MKDKYTVEYVKELEFRRSERNLRKYNMLAYKKWIFNCLPNIINGNFTNDNIKFLNNINNNKYYKCCLSTDIDFRKVHGEIEIYFIVDLKNKIIYLDKIEPECIFSEMKELETYKGILVSNKNREKDIFKINALKMLKK